MNLGFIGLGNQGAPLAKNIVADGHKLSVFDTNDSAVVELLRAGATRASSPGDVARHAAITFVCVRDRAQVLDVICGNGGILGQALADSIIVIHSTIDIEAIDAIGNEAARLQVHVVDAPVAGGTAAAQARALLVLAGGAPSAVERCMPILESHARHVVRTGPLGSAMKAKAVHQLILCINMMAVYEGTVLGRAWQLPSEVLIEVIKYGGAQSGIAERWPTLVVPSHAADLFRKDIRISLDAAVEMGLSLPGAAVVEARIGTIIADRVQQHDRQSTG